MTEPLVESSEFVEVKSLNLIRIEIDLPHEHFQRIADKPENKDYRFKTVEYLQKTPTEKIPLKEKLIVIDAISGKTFGFEQEIGDAVSIHEKNVLTSKAMAELTDALGESKLSNNEFDKSIIDAWTSAVFNNMNVRLPTTLKGVEESIDSWTRMILEELEMDNLSGDIFLIQRIKNILLTYSANSERINEIKERNESREFQIRETRDKIVEKLLTDRDYSLCTTRALKTDRLQKILDEEGIQFFTKREDIPYIIDRAKQLVQERKS